MYCLNQEEVNLYKSGNWMIALANLRNRYDLTLYEGYDVFNSCGYPIAPGSAKIMIHDKVALGFAFNWANN